MYMERVSRHVEIYPEGVSRTAAYRDVTGRRERVIEAVNHLVRDGFLADNGKLLTIVCEYRDPVPGSTHGSQAVPATNDSPRSLGSRGSQAVPDHFPNPVPASVPPGPPPQGGEPGTKGTSPGTTTTVPEDTTTPRAAGEDTTAPSDEPAVVGHDVARDADRPQECVDCYGPFVFGAPGSSPLKCPDCNGYVEALS